MHLKYPYFPPNEHERVYRKWLISEVVGVAPNALMAFDSVIL
jgi:hypothetical protein